MRLPIDDKKFLFYSPLLIVIILEILSIIGIHNTYALWTFIFAAFIIGLVTS
jgi:hypothetical protein